MSSHVVVRELLRRGMKRTVERGDFDVDSKDEDGCLELLRRIAKRNGVKATDCEITVKTVRTTKTYRM